MLVIAVRATTNGKVKSSGGISLNRCAVTPRCGDQRVGLEKASQRAKVKEEALSATVVGELVTMLVTVVESSQNNRDRCQKWRRSRSRDRTGKNSHNMRKIRKQLRRG